MKRGFLNTRKARDSPDDFGTTSAAPAVPTKEGSGQAAAQDSNEVLAVSKDYKILENAVIKNTAIITTIPPFPNGIQVSQMVTVPSTKDFILKARGFPGSIPNPTLVKYEVRETPVMGLGLFATADIAFGETILAERPLVVIPKNIGLAFKIPRTGLIEGEWHGVCMDEGEKLLGLALERMNQEEQDLFRSLCNICAEDPGRRPLISILVCNAMNLEFADPPAAQGFGNGYIGIPRVGSRINNSCTPNAVFNFDPDAFSLLYTATRDIKAGDQIFLGYFPAAATLAQRRRGMARYRFVCECNACTNATDETDNLRTGYNLRIANLVRQAMTSATTTPPQELLPMALKLKQELEKEGLDSEPKFSEVWVVLQTLYQKSGNSEEQSKCKKRLETYLTFPGYRKALKQAQGLSGF